MTSDERFEGRCPFCTYFVRFIQSFTHGMNSERSGTEMVRVTGMVCPRCDKPLVVVTSSANANDWSRYPGVQPIDVPNTPDRVREAFREAQISLSAGAPHAAATMLRRTVASTATYFGIADRDDKGRFIGLFERIDGLKEKLLPSTYEAARHMKILGDAGAHEEAETDFWGEITTEDVNAAAAIIRHFLANLFEMPEEIRKVVQPQLRGQTATDDSS
jgi:hypothetical protein